MKNNKNIRNGLVVVSVIVSFFFGRYTMVSPGQSKDVVILKNKILIDSLNRRLMFEVNQNQFTIKAFEQYITDKKPLVYKGQNKKTYEITMIEMEK